MGLRIFGALVAVVLCGYTARRYRRGQLRRGEVVVIVIVALALIVAAIDPDLLDPILGSLGFERGQRGRIIGLLVISNVFTLALLFRGFSRDDQLSEEVGNLVDYVALKRLDDRGWNPIEGGCAVVIPAYNEEDNLPTVLKEMPSEVEGLPVYTIVIADGCTDSTEEVARALGANVIRRDLRRGSGAAVRLGYRAALKSGAKVVVTLDADGQHDPTEIAHLVKPLIVGDADMVQGSRILGSFEFESHARKHGVRVFARMLTTLGRTKITDPSTGYRAITADALRHLDLRQDQFYVSEVILDAARKGLQVVEVPITMRKRASGASKKPTSFRYAWGFSKAIVRTWFR
ncbi:MAG: glycosyltransferase family 2 protein [Actinobacteria bacterium]|nr:glycosyltransferase family 2 protein [Actinomycetota bacterium]